MSTTNYLSLVKNVHKTHIIIYYNTRKYGTSSFSNDLKIEIQIAGDPCR